MKSCQPVVLLSSKRATACHTVAGISQVRLVLGSMGLPVGAGIKVGTDGALKSEPLLFLRAEMGEYDFIPESASNGSLMLHQIKMSNCV